MIEPRTFPKGMDTEVISGGRGAVGRGPRRATEPYDREHVTRAFVRDRPDRFPPRRSRSSPAAGRRCPGSTLDTAEDLERLRELVRPGRGPGTPRSRRCSTALLDHLPGDDVVERDVDLRRSPDQLREVARLHPVAGALDGQHLARISVPGGDVAAAITLRRA